MVDALIAVVTHLKADDEVAAIVGTRVFAIELPGTETGSMPRDAVVVVPAGGSDTTEDWVRASEQRLDIWNYGTTPYDAWLLAAATHDAMRHDLRRTVAGNVLLHRASVSSMPRTFKGQDTDWPITLETFNVFASENAIT